MKGLLIKDLKLIKNNKRFFAALILICVILLPLYHAADFCASYITMMFAVFTLSTLSYDEMDNGMAYLFTLPISRKDYVREKYVFGILISIVPCLVANIIRYLVGILMGNPSDSYEYLFSSAFILVTVYLVLAIEIPLRIQYGQTKSRMASMLPLGILFVFVMSLSGLQSMGVVDIAGVIDAVVSLGVGTVCVAALVICAALWAISYLICVRIMERKEF